MTYTIVVEVELPVKETETMTDEQRLVQAEEYVTKHWPANSNVKFVDIVEIIW